MATRTQSTGTDRFTTRAVEELRDSVLAKVAAFGLVLVALSVAIEAAIRSGLLVRGISGVWATIFLLWGVALVVLGTVGRTAIWWRRR